MTSTTDPLLTLLATIERLDREATRGPWRACCAGREHACRTGLVWADDGETNIASGPETGCARPTPEQIARNTILIAFSRNTLAPLASMLRVAVEALDKIEQPPALDEDGDTWCEYDEIDWMKSKARAALATIRRMAEEVERG